MKRLFLTAFGFLLFLLAARAQEPTHIIKIWGNKYTSASDPEQRSYNSRGEVHEYSKVTDPEIHVWLPEPEKANGTALMVCPGGAMVVLAWEDELMPLVRDMVPRGIAVIGVKYRLNMEIGGPPGGRMRRNISYYDPSQDDNTADVTGCNPRAGEDLAQARRIVLSHAKEWNIDVSKLGYVGFSAGGEAVSDNIYGVSKEDMPAFVASIYSPILKETFPENAPKAFIAVHADHPNVAAICLKTFMAWKRAGLDAEFHAYGENTGNLFGSPHGEDASTSEGSWRESFYSWLSANGFIEKYVVPVTGGLVQGVDSDTKGVTVYRGIPYAAPPVAENRWKAPQPVIPWEGVRVCDSFSAAAVQPKHGTFGLYEKEFYADGDPEFSEDCLYLNVWTPAPGKENAKLPVVVWSHGGAYIAGWGFEKEMDGEAWANRGVILVTINYRLGIFGCLAHPALAAEDPNGSSGNYGFLDQRAALLWVKDNIRAFGGDPDNITVMGQSAGAGSVMNQIASPLTRDLVSKVIIQSGGGGLTFEKTDIQAVKAEKQALGKAVMDLSGLSDLQKMRAASTQEIWDAHIKYTEKTKQWSIWRPSPDGYALTGGFFESVEENSIADIPILVGSVRDDAELAPWVATNLAKLRRERSDKPVWVYQFARPLPGDEEGAFHSAELWYTFGTLGRCWRPFTKGDYQLSDRMLDCWTNFAKYGNPNGTKEGEWTPFDGDENKMMVFKLDDNNKDASAMGAPLPKEKHFRP